MQILKVKVHSEEKRMGILLLSAFAERSRSMGGVGVGKLKLIRLLKLP